MYIFAYNGCGSLGGIQNYLVLFLFIYFWVQTAITELSASMHFMTGVPKDQPWIYHKLKISPSHKIAWNIISLKVSISLSPPHSHFFLLSASVMRRSLQFDTVCCLIIIEL